MILVTGGGGFIGKALVEKLVSQGHEVSVLALPGEKLELGNVGVFRGDITDRASLPKGLEEAETVIHLAGMVSYSKPRDVLFKVNAEGTRNVLEACKGAKKFILASSVSIYGEVKGTATEDYPTSPKNPYGESKAEAERIVKESRADAVVFRIAPVYGKGAPSWLKNLRLLEKGFPIPKTSNTTHVVHISDVVQALSLAVGKGRGVYNIADKEPVKFVDFAEQLMGLLGKKPKRLPMWLVSMLARMKGMKTYLDVLTMNRNYDISKAGKELGYSPKTNIEQGIKEMVDWYKGTKQPL